jgi:hypothetical protein
MEKPGIQKSPGQSPIFSEYGFGAGTVGTDTKIRPGGVDERSLRTYAGEMAFTGQRGTQRTAERFAQSLQSSPSIT